jgi:hypothetical protein
MVTFFMTQPLVAMAEALVIEMYSRMAKPKQTPSNDQSPHPVRQYSKYLSRFSHIFIRLIGYVWVFCWFTFIGWWFTKPYAALGVLEWQLPFSVVGKILIDGW